MKKSGMSEQEFKLVLGELKAVCKKLDLDSITAWEHTDFGTKFNMLRKESTAYLCTLYGTVCAILFAQYDAHVEQDELSAEDMIEEAYSEQQGS